jgi:glycosyltransferase involved in cell wall biosynthesis
MLLSVIILTKDEEANLPSTLASMRKLEADIYIVDSGSTDQTIAIAEKYGCKIFNHSFVNQAQQINWALENLPINTPWTMRLDADERLMPELVQELNQILSQSPDHITAYQLKRRVYFMGRWMRHGGYYPTWLLRVWRTGLATCEQRWMDEHIVISKGEVASLKYDIIDENKKGLTFWIDKHNRYADREVKDMLAIRQESDQLLTDNSQKSQASQRRWMKTNMYAKFPLFWRALIYFLLRYTVGLGFLDGREGLIFHFLQGFWYRFLVDAKIYDIERERKQ